MNIKPLHENFKAPFKGSDSAAGYDLFMPEAGILSSNEIQLVPLGFSSAIPNGYVGIIVPRSGIGVKHGLELNNTCGIIDSDYRGEWVAALRLKDSRSDPLVWGIGDRLLQIVFVPYGSFDINITDTLEDTSRGEGGFGSTGK